jgi:hypothetical protein
MISSFLTRYLNLNSLLLAGGMNKNYTITFLSAELSDAGLIPCSLLQGEFILGYLNE